jgi:hypothetical protein
VSNWAEATQPWAHRLFSPSRVRAHPRTAPDRSLAESCRRRTEGALRCHFPDNAHRFAPPHVPCALSTHRRDQVKAKHHSPPHGAPLPSSSLCACSALRCCALVSRRASHQMPQLRASVSTSCSATIPEWRRRPSCYYELPRWRNFVPPNTPSSPTASGPPPVKPPPPRGPHHYTAASWTRSQLPPTPYRAADVVSPPAERRCRGEAFPGEPLPSPMPPIIALPCRLALGPAPSHLVVGHHRESAGAATPRRGFLPFPISLKGCQPSSIWARPLSAQCEQWPLWMSKGFIWTSFNSSNLSKIHRIFIWI